MLQSDMEFSHQVTTVTAPAQGLITFFQYIIIMDTLASIQTFMCIFGLITNTINIKTFLAMRAFDDGVTLTFLLLSISDLCVCLVSVAACTSTFLVSFESKLLSKLINDINFANIEDKLGYFFPFEPKYLGIFCFNSLHIFSLMTILLTIYLAVARCLCVMCPIKFRNIITVRKTVFVSSIFFLSSLGLRLPLMAYYGVSPRFDPRINATRYRLWVHADWSTITDALWDSVDAFVCLAAQVILTVSIAIMARVLGAAAEFRSKASLPNGSNSDMSKSKNRLSTKDARIIKQLILVSSIFIICNTPKLVAYFVAAIEPDLLDVGNERHGGVDEEHQIYINTYDSDDGLLNDPQTNGGTNDEMMREECNVADGQPQLNNHFMNLFCGPMFLRGQSDDTTFFYVFSSPEGINDLIPMK
ncbi:chemosensory receptor c [Plakobranchus ocellatus]|uniref:Chemosensory receptor c n=1 Tax=Plakobranchus ocellatus TaxID=259542 RepID=A0AAV4B424_9GAST|nr:chemosensory receptor c [Plakobranchus ocellatus]